MTSGSSYDEFNVEPAQEKAFKELLRNARQMRGWSQQQAADATGVAQTVISSLERGPYPGMRLWDIWRLCDGYGIEVVDIRKALGWYGEREKDRMEEHEDPRLAVAIAALKNLDDHHREILLQTINHFILGVHDKDTRTE